MKPDTGFKVHGSGAPAAIAKAVPRGGIPGRFFYAVQNLLIFIFHQPDRSNSSDQSDLQSNREPLNRERLPLIINSEPTQPSKRTFRYTQKPAVDNNHL